jgi:hypothetical protein
MITAATCGPQSSAMINSLLRLKFSDNLYTNTKGYGRDGEEMNVENGSEQGERRWFISQILT